MTLNTELVAGIAAYYRRIEALGGYGARVSARTVGTDGTLLTGWLGEAGSGGCQPMVVTDDGRRYRICLDTVTPATVDRVDRV